MKWLLFFTFISHGLWAQTVCDKPNSEACQKLIKSSIFHRDDKTIKSIMAKNGIEPFFDESQRQQSFNHIGMAAFYDYKLFFKELIKSESYPSDIPDKNNFLKEIFSVTRLKSKDPEMMQMIFYNPDQSKTITWWENAEWPYPLLEKFRSEILARPDKEKYQSMIDYFDQLDMIKKDICQIKTLDQFVKRITAEPDMLKLFKNHQFNLMKCAVESGEIDLAQYLLDGDMYDPKDLSNFSKKFEMAPMTKKNITFLKTIEKKMRESGIPHANDKSLKNVWALNNLNPDTECLTDTLIAPGIDARSLTDISNELVFNELIKEFQYLKLAHQKSDKVDKDLHLQKIKELITKTNLPVNYIDRKGRTFLHYLAEFADATIIQTVIKDYDLTGQFPSFTIQDQDGNTPLHVGILNKNMPGSTNIISYYWKRKEIKAKNADGKTPLKLLKEMKVDEKNEKEEMEKNRFRALLADYLNRE